MLETVESGGGFEKLRAFAQAELDAGVASEVLLDDLENIRALVDEQTEDLVLDVMDLLSGWCAPSARLQRRDST